MLLKIFKKSITLSLFIVMFLWFSLWFSMPSSYKGYILMQGLKPTESKCGDFNIYINTGRDEYILHFVIPFFTSNQGLILPEVIILSEQWAPCWHLSEYSNHKVIFFFHLQCIPSVAEAFLMCYQFAMVIITMARFSLMFSFCTWHLKKSMDSVRYHMYVREGCS